MYVSVLEGSDHDIDPNINVWVGSYLDINSYITHKYDGILMNYIVY